MTLANKNGPECLEEHALITLISLELFYDPPVQYWCTVDAVQVYMAITAYEHCKKKTT